MFVWMTLLAGLAYPLLITGMAQLTMKTKADGDMMYSKGKIVGSKWIAQKFESDKYFWPRPSSIDYNPLPSGGSNLGPTSSALKKAVEERKEKISRGKKVDIPSELLFASGSGLDPHISLSTAYFQIDRIIKARGLDRQSLENLIKDMTIKRSMGFIGEPCVNVLELNIALDNL